jgi:hypothetical protein
MVWNRALKLGSVFDRDDSILRSNARKLVQNGVDQSRLAGAGCANNKDIFRA